MRMTVNARNIGNATLLAVCVAVAVPLAVEYQNQAAAGAPAARAADPSKKPDDNRFTPVVVVPPGELDEPMAFDVARNGKVYIIERKGAFKVYDPTVKTTRVIA